MRPKPSHKVPPPIHCFCCSLILLRGNSAPLAIGPSASLLPYSLTLLLADFLPRVFSDNIFLAIPKTYAIMSQDEHLLYDRQCRRPGLKGPLAAPKTSRRPTGGARPAPRQWTTPCASQKSMPRFRSLPSRQNRVQSDLIRVNPS